MFSDLVDWYAGHAATIFAVLVTSAIGLEVPSRWAAGRLDRGERTAVLTSLTHSGRGTGGPVDSFSRSAGAG